MSESARKLPNSIEVVQYADRWSLKVDGVEFPWYISGEDGISTTVDSGGIPRVTFTMFANRVTVEHDLTRAPEVFPADSPIYFELMRERIS